MTQANALAVNNDMFAHYLPEMGVVETVERSQEPLPEPPRIVPHSRTLRKAREQVKYMVFDGVSPRRIRNYLHQWVTW